MTVFYFWEPMIWACNGLFLKEHTLFKYADAATDCLPCIKGRRREGSRSHPTSWSRRPRWESARFPGRHTWGETTAPQSGGKGRRAQWGRGREKPTSTRVPLQLQHLTRFSSQKAQTYTVTVSYRDNGNGNWKKNPSSGCKVQRFH